MHLDASEASLSRMDPQCREHRAREDRSCLEAPGSRFCRSVFVRDVFQCPGAMNRNRAYWVSAAGKGQARGLERRRIGSPAGRADRKEECRARRRMLTLACRG